MTAKKRILSIFAAVLLAAAMSPMTAGTVYAIDADVTPPEIDVSLCWCPCPKA